MTATIQSTFRVGRRWTVELTVPPFAPGTVMAMNMAWSPDVPDRRLNKREMADYRRGRAMVLSEVARMIGGPVACIEGSRLFTYHADDGDDRASAEGCGGVT